MTTVQWLRMIENEERQVRLAEQQARLVVDVICALLDELR